VSQGRYENRPIEKTLDIGWELLSMVPQSYLTRVDKQYIEKYYKASPAGKT
jgi:V/A-type H+-transporting ATPase subunit B